MNIIDHDPVTGEYQDSFGNWHSSLDDYEDADRSLADTAIKEKMENE